MTFREPQDQMISYEEFACCFG